MNRHSASGIVSRARLLPGLVAVVVAVGWIIGMPSAARADGPTTFSNTTRIDIPAAGATDQQGVASPYPSAINVSGMTGVISDVTVSLNGLTHGAVNDLDVLVVGPGGSNLVVLSDVGDQHGANPPALVFATNATLTFSDSATGEVPRTPPNLVSGTYRPTNHGGGVDVFPDPAPAVQDNTTLGGAFAGRDPNGTWRLFVVDDTSGDLGQLAGGWSVTITTTALAQATTTALASSSASSFLGDPVTFTASVVAGQTSVTTGAVQFLDGTTNLGAPVALNSAGVAALTTSALSEGTHQIRATYVGTSDFLTSTTTLGHRVDRRTTVLGTMFCNDGPIAMPPAGAATPYPSNVFVSGVPGNITKVTATLRGVTHQASIDLDVMLSGPGNQNLFLLSDAGGNNNPVNNATITFDDDAPTTVPSPIVSGTFQPTRVNDEVADPFPAPAPTPSGSTSLSVFDGRSPNGTWSLWVVDDATGDTGSIAGGWCVTITSQVPSTTSLTSSANPSVYGDSVTFTATVASGADAVDDGAVQFSVGGAPLGAPVDVDAAGVATVTTSTLGVGSHTITAAYGGTATVAESSNTLTQVVNKVSSTTAVTSDGTPSVVGDPVTFTATVTSGGQPVDSGTIQFSDASGDLGAPVAVAADGTATFTTSALPVGSHTITATFSGTATTATSSGSTGQTVDATPTTTGLTSSLNPSDFGDPVTFTATVTSSGQPVDSGTIQFSDADGDLGSPVAVAADGTATFTTSALPVGTHTVTATFSGTATLAVSSDTLSQVVGQAESTTVVTSDGTPSVVGDPVTFTATVTSGGQPVDSGTVQFSDADGDLGSPVDVEADGTATFTTSALPVGSHTITATFSGTVTTATSSGSTDQTVNQVSTSVAVGTDGSPSTFGDEVTFTATVTTVPGGDPVTVGQVEFSVDGTVSATVDVDASGVATVTTDTLAVGTHTITAAYLGTTDYATSSGTVDQVVDAAPTATVLTSSLNPSTFGDSVTFTATVTSGGQPVSSGTVQFSDAGGDLGAPVDVEADGTATFTTSALPVGDHTITATFSGNATTATSSGSIDQTVDPLPPPVADAGGPYTVAEGESLTLDGSGSTSGVLAWDLNGDDDFGDAAGEGPTLTWADLEALGIDDGPATHEVRVRVTANGMEETSAVVVLTVTNTAPASVLTGGLTATVGEPFTIKVGAEDPSSADMEALFTYTVDWGDGSPVTSVVGPADPPVTHTYASAGTYQAVFTATDKDGGLGPGTEVSVVAKPAGSTDPDGPDDGDDGDGGSGGGGKGSGTGGLASTGPGNVLALAGLALSLVVGGGLLVGVRRRA